MEQDFPKIPCKNHKKCQCVLQTPQILAESVWAWVVSAGLAHPVSKLAKSTPEAMQKDEKVIQIGPNGFKLGPEGYYMVS